MDAVANVAPFDALRQRLGLSILELAEMCGCSYSRIYNAIRGYAPIPRKALEALAELGIDALALRAEHVRWQEQRTQVARADLKQRLQAQAGQ